MIEKPDRIFDRDAEWNHLSSFAARAADRPQLGVVSGRRRQGKTFLVEALSRATGGFYYGATEATENESLGLFSDAVTRFVDAPVALRFADWDEVVRYLYSVDRLRGRTVVIDEFPYLSKASPALPSIVQREIDAAASSGAAVSLLLCGSAMSVMGGLLAGNAPLRGRANLELIVRPFDYRMAARFWGITDPKLAAMVNAVVGGTPAYRRFVNEDAPSGIDDFTPWVLRAVLDPATPLFREARYLLEEEVEVRETGLYHSTLAAVAEGNTSRGAIANYVGRKAADLGHYLNVLEDSGLLRRDADLFRSGRSQYRTNEALITFYQVVMRPQWSVLESGRSESVWQDAWPRFLSQVVGPSFEQMCREFAVSAPPEMYGALPGEVGSGVVADHQNRQQIEIDVAVLAPSIPGEPRRVLSLGEAKWGKVMGARHVDRLRRARDILAAKGYDTRDTVLACYSGAGFEPDLENRPGERVMTIGLDTLYDA